MHFLVDAQLPPSLCRWFVEQGHEASHVTDLLGGQTPDEMISEHAELHQMTLVTKDDDFVLHHSSKSFRLIWLRCGNITNASLRLWMSSRWSGLVGRLSEGERFIEVR